MHPAYSVIVFTTASGAGYGLLFWLSLAHVAGALPDSRWMPFLTLALALALISVGLLSSTAHLGRPERAWRAVSQWRSSWLSREGVAALATYVPAGLLALVWLFGMETPLSVFLALLSALGAIVTVWCTGMIYASLRTIRQWNMRLVPVIYEAMAAASGAVLLAAALALAGDGSAWAGIVALVMLLVAGLLKWRYYSMIDADPGRYSAQMALGIGAAPLRQLDPPHTRPNFVMREMGYQVGRKHAASLRRLALLCLFVLPAVMVLAALVIGLIAPVIYVAAAAAMAVGLVTERWLFFAEAEHVSMLYYGRQRA